MSERAKIDATMATVVSVLPFKIDEIKPGVYPGHFIIEAAEKDKFKSIIIGPSRYHVYIPIAERIMTVEEHAHGMARSIVEDYIGSALAVSGDARPGIFWLTGAKSESDIANHCKLELEEAKQSQKRWFTELVKLADDDWAKYHLHAAISDLQRYAANYLGLEREWLRMLKEVEITSCKVCRSPIHPEAIVCPVCRSVLNQTEYAKVQKAS